ncbi:hypothetical protein ACIRRA_24790 [Nocardia sp. NPDC101769]|uniref:hypothetical protein n=1 Tax=Nocardia sp. NPDC101769 TaxID=3364333 RepID=UPI0037F7FFBF
MPVLTGLGGAADLIRAGIGIRRQLLDADIYSRTADYTTVPDRIRRRRRATIDNLLPADDPRCQCAAMPRPALRGHRTATSRAVDALLVMAAIAGVAGMLRRCEQSAGTAASNYRAVL